MTKILKATHEGDLKIGNITIQSSVLEGGIRVLSWSGVNRAFGSSIGGVSGKIGVRSLPRILEQKAVKPFISEELSACAEHPYEFQPKRGGRTAYGYEAALLPMMCEAIIDANKAASLKNQEAVINAELLLRGFARVGIVALIDEATGYQEIRDKKALAAILDKYLRKELAAWAKRFPDEFYKEMFRLRGWAWNPTTVKRPSVVGKYTNDLVYERLAPQILEELEKRNPKNESGNRVNRHHQWLTDEIGNPALTQHIHAIMGFMRAASKWDDFYRLVQRAFPKKNDQLSLLVED